VSELPVTAAGPADRPHPGPAVTPAVLPPVTPWPVTGADVAAWLSLTDPTAQDVAILDTVAAQATIYAQRCRFDRWSTDPDTGAAVFVPDVEVFQGAVMFGAREYRRRNTPAGMQNFGDGGVSYVARWDNDIDRALRVGAFRPPAVG
jgi:hypothetical protein